MNECVPVCCASPLGVPDFSVYLKVFQRNLSRKNVPPCSLERHAKRDVYRSANMEPPFAYIANPRCQPPFRPKSDVSWPSHQQLLGVGGGRADQCVPDGRHVFAKMLQKILEKQFLWKKAESFSRSLQEFDASSLLHVLETLTSRKCGEE